MQRFKAHIAIFLLAGFLFPQAASGMHYFVVEHFPSKNSEITFYESNNFDYHSCIYHLNGFSPLLIKENYLKKLSQHLLLTTKAKFCCLQYYVHQPDFNFQLRGPPFKMNFQN
ncbi:MAG: hypothetical protein R3353_10580 [Salegentibacter mishustinae]|nr:hypothetical protein [Salegentibacter mishustinae]